MCARYTLVISHAYKPVCKQYIPILYFMLQKYIVQVSHKKLAHDLKYDNKYFSNRAVEQSACSDIYRQEAFVGDSAIDSVAQVSSGNRPGSLE